MRFATLECRHGNAQNPIDIVRPYKRLELTGNKIALEETEEHLLPFIAGKQRFICLTVPVKLTQCLISLAREFRASWNMIPKRLDKSVKVCIGSNGQIDLYAHAFKQVGSK